MKINRRAAAQFARLRAAVANSKVQKLFGLTAIRILAAAGSLISVTVIVRAFPVVEAGKFFVFLAAAQFLGGAALGPLLMLAIRFGSVHRADGDREALGRLILFGTVAIGLLMVVALLIHPLATQLTGLELGEPWIFASVAGLGGAMMFLGGLARVNEKVIAAVVPENILRPLGLALAAIALWLAGAATFPALAAAYGGVLLAVCTVLAAMAPWRAMRFVPSDLSVYRPYSKAYGPLLAYGLVSTGLNTFDILIVSHAVSVEAVPAYKAALQYVTLLTTGVIFANLIFGPQIAVAHQRGDLAGMQRLARSSSRLALGFYALSFAPLLIGPWLFELAFGAIGTEAWGLALILCAGRFANAWFGSVTNIANLTGRTTLLAVIQCGSVVLLIVFAPLLGAGLGSKGVAIVSALAVTSWVVATTFFLQRGLRLKMGPI